MSLFAFALSAPPPPSPHPPRFASVSVTPCPAFRPRPLPETPGRLQTGCTSLDRLILQAYGLYAGGHMHPLANLIVDGGPSWLKTDLYQIDATAPGQTHAMMNGPMLQDLLEDRFQLHAHRDTEIVPAYVLTAAKNTLSLLTPFQGTCIEWAADDPPPHRDPEKLCATPSHITDTAFDLNAATMEDLCFFLSLTLDKPVVDQTAITGRFVFHLEIPTDQLRHEERGLSAYRKPGKELPPANPAFVAAAKAALQKLGLRLEATTAPRPIIVIDTMARP